MTKKEFDTLYSIYKVEQRRKRSIKGESQEILQCLVGKGYCTKDFKLTEKGRQELDKYKIDNAIILAAGMSTRFAPVCFDIAKGLIPVNGESLIERQIRQLREVGINEIVLVVGYRPEQFEKMVLKHELKVVYNPLYSTRNNYYSVFLCKKYLRNTIITSSDLYFSDNLFESHAFDAYYTSIFMEGPTEERGLILDENDRMVKTYYGDCHDVWVTLGYAYYSKRFSDNYIRIVEQYVDERWIQNMFWADIQDRYLEQLFMYIKRCSSDQIHEFDYLYELKKFDGTFQAINYSPTMRKICGYFGCVEDELSNFQPLIIKGTSRYSCTFWYNEEKYAYCMEELNMDSAIEALLGEASGCFTPKREALLENYGAIWKL